MVLARLFLPVGSPRSLLVDIYLSHIFRRTLRTVPKNVALVVVKMAENRQIQLFT